MKKLFATLLTIAIILGITATGIKSAEMMSVYIPFTGRWQPSEDPVLLDANGLQDIQNLRRSGQHFKGISGHTTINTTSLSATPLFLNGWHFSKDQPAESHVLVVAADTATPTASYLFENTTEIPSVGDFGLVALHTDAAGGLGTGRFSVAPQGNMVYSNGAETLIWGGNEIEATAVIAVTSALTTATAALENPQDLSSQLRNTRQTADQVAAFGTVIDSYTKLLIHSDGTDASTIIVDEISNAITAGGSAQIDTSAMRYGLGSLLYASATTDAITASDSTDWDLGSGHFTIDAWVRPTSFITVSGGTAESSTPPMTSDVTPSPYVSSGGVGTLAGFPAWKAFDQSTGAGTGGWKTVRSPVLKLDLGLGNGKVATKYTIIALPDYEPKTWTFEGSNDNTAWTTLDTQTNVTAWTDYAVNTYTFSNTTVYRYYRINITATNDAGGSAVGIGELAIFTLPYSNATILSQASTGNFGWAFYASGNALTFSYSTDGSTVQSKSVPWYPQLNTWYHLAVARTTSLLRFFSDGVLQGSSQDVTGLTISNSTASLSSGNLWNGWIDELRLSKGIARWSSYFVPNTAPYTTGNPTWFVGFTRPLKGIKLYITTPNLVASTLTGKEWNGVGWNNLSLTDNTSVEGISLAQTGTVTWPTTVNSSVPKYLYGMPIYWYQFNVSAGAATVYYVTVDSPMQPLKANIWDGRELAVGSCLKWDGTNYVDYTDAVNDDTNLTYLEVSSLSTAHHFVTGFTQPMQAIDISMVAGKENISASTQMTGYYWDGTAWNPAQGFSDGTRTSTTSLSKNGIVSWQSPAPGMEREQSIGEGAGLFYYKFSFAGGLDATTQISEIRGIAAPTPIGSYAFSETFANRLFLFNEKSGEKNKAIYSVDNSPDIFTGSDAGSLTFGDRTEIVAATEVYNVIGGSDFDQLIVGKKSEIYRLTGNSPATWNIMRISAKVGVIAPLSMVSCEVSGKENETRNQVAIWQGDKGFYMTDGANVVLISDDIKVYFDPNDSRYIPTARRTKTVAWYDPSLRVYKALISSGASQTTHNIELEYNLLTREWTKIYRENTTVADPLQCGFQVSDTNGTGYTYGGNKGGYLYRLENGNTFAGKAISQYLQTKDIAVDPMKKSTIKYMRTANKKKTSGGTITPTHYGDQVLTVNGASNQIVPSAFSAATAPYNTQSCNLGPFLYHNLKFSVSDSTAAGGMELIGVGLYLEPQTAIR